MTNNVRSYANTFRLLVVMKAWRNVLLSVSHDQVCIQERQSAY